MKKIVFPIFFATLIVSFIIINPSHAETSSITSKTTSTFTSTSITQTNSHSKVTITCDGKTYTYESDGNIDENPCKGASVKINTYTTPGATNSPVQINEDKNEEVTEEVTKKVEEKKEKIQPTITATPKKSSPSLKFDLGSWLRSFFSSLFK